MTLRTDLPKPVTLTVPAQLTDDQGLTATIRTAWIYDLDQPHALTLRMIVGTGPNPRYTEWLFARSLLWQGLAFPIGDGDVRIDPIDSSTVVVALSSPSGEATLAFPLEALAAFAARIYALVPDGQEPEPDLSAIENVLRAAAEVGEDW
jgi:hypothetical protein